MINLLTKILLIISNALLVPDILLLFFFTGVTVVYLGGIIAEYLKRKKYEPLFREFISEIKSHPERRLRVEDIPSNYGFVSKVLMKMPRGAYEKQLDDAQLAMESAVSRLSLGIRLGPMLGLAGTLIPLGPALVAMAEGNIAALSQNLVIAFTTTVVGLFIGGVSYVMYLIRQRWYAQDLNDLEFIIKRLE
ncbi:MAG: MotA/TolQ/ExbB proton channel family protein [Planctomycetota bacterium]|nr:MotA/TolQ/ExbB proton channel family protein [Planctomycetota bacterium]